MILRPFASGSLAATVLATRPTPSGLVEERGRKGPEKGDFAGSGSFSIGSADDASLYFHIPFCTKKCPYCHFYVIPNQGRYHPLLSEGLALEWERSLPLLAGKRIVSIYFGGGTPTLFAPDGIGAVLARVRDTALLSPDCEITVEANPEEAGKGLFEKLARLGVNRLSIGVQSLDDRSLAVLERSHGAKLAKAAIQEAYGAGLANISIDLMYDLPDQTESSWQYTLNEATALPISHLSLYNLTIEPHTSFYKRRGELCLPKPEASLRMLDAAIQAIEKMGLKRYEISAFVKKGMESRHNLGYWTGRPFLGFGPSAFSDWEGERFRNAANLQRYVRSLRKGESPVDFSEKLPYPANLKERLTVRLRLFEGVDLGLFAPLPSETRAVLERWAGEGHLIEQGARIRLSERGALFYDTLAAELI